MTKQTLWILIAVVLLATGVGFLLSQIISTPTIQRHEMTFTVVVLPPGDFSITVEPVNSKGEPEITVYKGQPAVFTIKATSTGGFDVPINLEVAGLPTGAVTFSQNPMPNDGQIQMTVDTSYLESNRTYVCTLVAKAGT